VDLGYEGPLCSVGCDQAAAEHAASLAYPPVEEVPR